MLRTQAKLPWAHEPQWSLLPLGTGTSGICCRATATVSAPPGQHLTFHPLPKFKNELPLFTKGSLLSGSVAVSCMCVCVSYRISTAHLLMEKLSNVIVKYNKRYIPDISLQKKSQYSEVWNVPAKFPPSLNALQLLRLVRLVLLPLRRSKMRNMCYFINKEEM